VAGFDVSGVEPSRSTTREFVSYLASKARSKHTVNWAVGRSAATVPLLQSNLPCSCYNVRMGLVLLNCWPALSLSGSIR
jgi:hypothetical protein